MSTLPPPPGPIADEAERAEREGRIQDAITLWRQAAAHSFGVKRRERYESRALELEGR